MNPAIPPPRVTDDGSRRQATEVLSTEAIRAKTPGERSPARYQGVALAGRCALLAAALGQPPLCRHRRSVCRSDSAFPAATPAGSCGAARDLLIVCGLQRIHRRTGDDA